MENFSKSLENFDETAEYNEWDNLKNADSPAKTEADVVADVIAVMDSVEVPDITFDLPDGYSPEAQSAKKLEQFRDQEIRLTVQTLSKDMNNYHKLDLIYQHEPSPELKNHLETEGRKISVTQDFYGEISDPDDNRLPSEVYSQLSAKYQRIAENARDLMHNDTFADDYFQRANIASKNADISKKRQNIFTNSKEPSQEIDEEVKPVSELVS